MDELSITITAKGGIDKYPAKAHARRTAARLGRSNGLIVLPGSKSAYYSHSDQQRPFRQDRYFYYLSGCNEPNCILTYDIARDWLTLFLPPISWARFYYDGRGSTTDEAMEAYDVDEAKYIRDEIYQQDVPIGLIVREHTRTQPKVFLLTHHAGEVLGLSLKEIGESMDFESLLPALDACRSVKDEHEIELIREANDITAAAHKDVLRQLHKCRSEADAEAIYLKRCVASLAKEQAYEPIFAAGVNASFLHYIQDNKPFADSQLLLIDAGCEWQRYSSDVTRTIPLNKANPGHWPSKEAKLLYEAVERVQDKCIALMKPGQLFSTVGRKAQDLIIDELRELRILDGNRDDILQAGTHRAFFPHGLGHHLGLEVHDVTAASKRSGSRQLLTRVIMPHCNGGMFSLHGDRSWTTMSSDLTSSEPPMEPGNVITVEPGIYFNKFVLDEFFLPDQKHARFINKTVLARYIPLGGVRIEDDILITEHGYENLTTTPKGAEALRIIREA